MFKEFKEFAARGNVLDMAVGVIIGAAAGKVVSSMVSDILMPPIGMLIGGVNFRDWFVTLSSGSYATLEEAKSAGATTLNYGLFISTIVDFVLVALAVFLIVKFAIRMRQRLALGQAAPPPVTKPCPECQMEIPIAANRCGHCTVVFAK